MLKKELTPILINSSKKTEEKGIFSYYFYETNTTLLPK